MSVMLCTRGTFLKKTSCLVARLVSFETVGLHRLYRYRIDDVIIIPSSLVSFESMLQVSQLLKYDGNMVIT